MNQPAVHILHPITSVDFSEIDAVGFDLDHTLALYDDAAVNLLAARETVPRLNAAGYAAAELPAERIQAGARGLSMDLRHGGVIKIASDGRVRLARRGPRWLSDDAIRAHYAHHDPADETATWHVNSPFDAPTLWFFSMLAGGRPDGDDARLLRDIRTSLDASHTRGELKQLVAQDLRRFVAPAGDVGPGVERWRRAGKRTFVVTNSDPDFAGRVLEHVLGPGWTSLFDLVVTDAHKPRFFDPAHADGQRAVMQGRFLDDGHASLVEKRLGVPPSRILYAGDNARADIAPARRRGWKTAHVVAELTSAPDDSPWAGALHHDGVPTWFAKTIHDHADIVCARIDALL